MRVASVVVLLLAMTSVTRAVEYDCKVTRKVDAKTVYTDEQLQRSQFSVRLTEDQKKASVSRCSFSPTAGKVTCDQYDVEHIAFDENVKIKKYYVFRSQYDVQLSPDLSFLENNGRGGVSYGKCTVVAP